MDAFKVILIIFLILLIIWILGKMFFTTNIVYDIMCDAKTPASQDSLVSNNSILTTNANVINNFPHNNTSNFMISVWFYIDDWENRISKEKNILFMSNRSDARTVFTGSDQIGISQKECKSFQSTTPYKNLNICLDDYNNNLLIDIETLPQSQENDSSYCYTRYLIKNVSVQKWNCLTISVDNKILDVYLDGKLRNSFILPHIYNSHYPSESNIPKKIYLGHINSTNSIGFEGMITRVRFEPNSINPQEAYNIYKEGINASLAKSLYDKYSMKVSFLEYNKEKGSFTI
tara:strand:+ start:15067 stop:15930 length:864 start_codon:yes stop_codon:yes gene_type:complete